MVGDRIWEQLGSYSGWMGAGCAAGAVAFTAYMRFDTLRSQSRVAGNFDRQQYELQALYSRYFAAFLALYPVHLLCVIFAMNSLLRRVSDHASHRSPA